MYRFVVTVTFCQFLFNRWVLLQNISQKNKGSDSKVETFLLSYCCFLPEEGLQWVRNIRESGLVNILKQRRQDTYLCGNVKRQSGISAGKRLSVSLHLEKMGLTCPRSRFYALPIAHFFKDLACSFMCKLFVSWEVLVLLFAFL